jgi:hypothetical protein
VAMEQQAKPRNSIQEYLGSFEAVSLSIQAPRAPPC